MSTERRAPVQGDYWLRSGVRGQTPGTIDWNEHVEAHNAYAREHDQSAERIAERGGFGYGEISLLLGRPPSTWRPLQAGEGFDLIQTKEARA